MLTLTIEITGKEYGDLELALEQVLEAIKSEYRSGFNSNDTGRYTFDVSGEEEEIIPTIDFEYDLSYYGGDYDGSGDTSHIPVSLIEHFGEEEAFEYFTKLHRCHIIHYTEEESESYGNGQTQDDIDKENDWFSVIDEEHMQKCTICQQLQQEIKGL